MKALILSASAGEGHNSCAEAIREVFAAHGDFCAVEDVFALLSKRLSRSISRNPEKTYRLKPRQSAASYRFLQRHPGLFSKHQLVYQVMSLGSRQLGRFIRAGGYDTVICTHVLAGMMLTAAIPRHGLNLHTAFVATDYSCSPGVNGTQLNRYFIPHAAIIPDFQKAGIPTDSIVVTGIPVRQAFSPVTDKTSAKASFGIDPAHRHLLIMCGSMGCGPIPQMLRCIAASMPHGWEISVVCGTNSELESSLAQAYHANPAIHIRGFVRNMPQLLSTADLYLTKPGGLSTAEAAAAAIPMVLVDAVAGCEANNLLHFVREGAAVTGNDAHAVAQACLALMNSPDRLAEMARILQRQSSASAAENIWQEMNRLF